MPIISNFIRLLSMSLMTSALVEKWQKNPRGKLASFNHYRFYYTSVPPTQCSVESSRSSGLVM